MEQERGSRLTANRELLVVARVILVLLALASALVGEGTGSDTGGATLGEAGSQGQAPRDWVTLLVVPLALAGVGYVYTSYETRRTRAVEETRSEENRISTFLDEMIDLIFEHDLRDSRPHSDVRRVATTRTLTVLLNMDSEHGQRTKETPSEGGARTGTRKAGQPDISLDQADLDRAALSEAVLPCIDLRGVYMRYTDLTAGLICETPT